ncbi:prepilin-type cleavage/methylation domain-containing protein [uncultured Legionella sp.]|uniref:prepilin-type cleavage/methylation domain-containing protein n=1 Tax=uncultured Legionella sp. TaxID=210934 RepID=UPI002603463B|nr:prepilin-type cleavage/methylation domain-containing protein [uncultured Legionella sp.]
MKQIKGFSLIEVFISLMLVTTLALMLLEQQINTHHLMRQWIMHAEASHVMDQVNETSLGQIERAYKVPEPYHLNVLHTNKQHIVQLEWFNKTGTLTRTIRSMG